MSGICWRDMLLAGSRLQAGCASRGEHVRLVMPEACQSAWLKRLIPQRATDTDEEWQVWLESGSASLQAGTPAFLEEVGIILRQRGALANLSLRENLLLPFLYNTEPEVLQQAEKELPEVAGFLGIADELEQQAGECSPYTHRLISLGRCLLQRPAVIVAQDVNAGIAFEHLPRFRSLFTQALDRLQSGLLYLSPSQEEQWDFDFDKTIIGRAI